MIRVSTSRGFKADVKGKRLEPNELEILVIKLRNGDRSVAEEIIGAHISLSLSIVAKFARRHYCKLDDLIGAAMLGLTQAVEWSAQGRLKDNNITPYIYATVKRFVREHIENDIIIRIPRKTYKINIQPIKVEPIKSQKFDPDNPEYDRYIDNDPAVEDDNDLFVQEILSMLPDRERTVLTKIMNGYTEEEIADEFGVTRQAISYIYKSIRSNRDLRNRLGWCFK